MSIRVGINGFGRIGRDLFRIVTEQGGTDIQVVDVNDLMPPETVAHLLRHDSTYGPWPHRLRDGMVKVFGWYDNEWGDAARLADLVALVGAPRP